MPVVVLDVDTKDLLQMAAPNDQQPIQALGADGADPPFCVRQDALTTGSAVCSMRAEGLRECISATHARATNGLVKLLRRGWAPYRGFPGPAPGETLLCLQQPVKQQAAVAGLAEPTGRAQPSRAALVGG
jgi:hypothetical protein